MAMRTDSMKARNGIAAAVLGLAMLGVAGGANGRNSTLVWLESQAKQVADRAMRVYKRTPADERVTWGALAACAMLAVGVTLERSVRVRRSSVIPKGYTGRFHERLVAGKLDRGKALDFCELNPSPAARVVLAAVRRWGRPAADMERGVALAKGIEVDRLRRHVGTLRRVAAMAPLIGLLGTLMAANRGLSVEGAVWPPILAHSLATLTVGVGLAILSLVAYDGLSGRVEGLSGALERLGAEAVDAIAMATSAPVEAKPEKKSDKVRRELANSPSTPHSKRVEIPLED